MLSIEDILGLPGIDDLPIEDALDGIGLLIDHVSDHSDRELADRALEWCGRLEGRELSPARRALLDYFLANAWANRQATSRSASAKSSPISPTCWTLLGALSRRARAGRGRYRSIPISGWRVAIAPSGSCSTQRRFTIVVTALSSAILRIST